MNFICTHPNKLQEEVDVDEGEVEWEYVKEILISTTDYTYKKNKCIYEEYY